MSARNYISKIWNNIQYNLFPNLEQDIGSIPEQLKKLSSVLEIVRIEDFIPSSRFLNGRPPKDTAAIARAFIAKIVLKIPYTNQLINYLKVDKQLSHICGFDRFRKFPSESKFSRMFKKFADDSLPEKVHNALLKRAYTDELFLHVTIDSTPIEAREKEQRKASSAKERKKQKDRKRAQAKRKGELNRRQKQANENDLEVSLKELPKYCDMGMKKSSQGYSQIWKGYKLHVAINDDCIPVAAIVSSASLNDCEVAIPLMKKSLKIAQNLYFLMDAAYDHKEIKEVILEMEAIGLIDYCPHNPEQKAEKKAEKERKFHLNFKTAEEKRYEERFPKERCNAMYKDFHGGNSIFVKGHSKISCHIMFGLLTLTASTLLKLIQ